jgi:hypothetical protein
VNVELAASEIADINGGVALGQSFAGALGQFESFTHTATYAESIPGWYAYSSAESVSYAF